MPALDDTSIPLRLSGSQVAYASAQPWSAQRPRSLVICCSDGRLQTSIDDFLHNHLGVDYYDRLYAPGGPGALAEGGSEFLRADLFRRQYEFLADAHAIEQVILIFHGAADDGPADAVCAHYRRLMPHDDNAHIQQRHLDDLSDILRHVFHAGSTALDILAFRAEVQADNHVRFVSLYPA